MPTMVIMLHSGHPQESEGSPFFLNAAEHKQRGISNEASIHAYSRFVGELVLGLLMM
jgi:hypothetical protein